MREERAAGEGVLVGTGGMTDIGPPEVEPISMMKTALMRVSYREQRRHGNLSVLGVGSDLSFGAELQRADIGVRWNLGSAGFRVSDSGQEYRMDR